MATPAPRVARRIFVLQQRSKTISDVAISPSQGFSGSKGEASRFALEIPLADSSAAATASLAAAVLADLGADGRKFTVVYADEAAARVGGPRAMALQAACRQASLSGPLMIVAPKVADVSGYSRICRTCWCCILYCLLTAA